MFLFFSITGARLTDNTVIKASELCSFDATVLTIDGFVNNPCIIPVSIVGGDFELRRTSNNKILAHGDIPAFVRRRRRKKSFLQPSPEKTLLNFKKF